MLVLMVAPMMPHLAEECWAALGHADLAAQAAWPSADRALVVEDTIALSGAGQWPQAGGSRRRARRRQRGDRGGGAGARTGARALEGRPVKKVIIVPQRIVNVVG